jgi:DNA invertase Pin-like site-specific DNA recombinase
VVFNQLKKLSRSQSLRKDQTSRCSLTRLRRAARTGRSNGPFKRLVCTDLNGMVGNTGNDENLLESDAICSSFWDEVLHTRYASSVMPAAAQDFTDPFGRATVGILYKFNQMSDRLSSLENCNYYQAFKACNRTSYP